MLYGLQGEGARDCSAFAWDTQGLGDLCDRSIDGERRDRLRHVLAGQEAKEKMTGET